MFAMTVSAGAWLLARRYGAGGFVGGAIAGSSSGAVMVALSMAPNLQIPGMIQGGRAWLMLGIGTVMLLAPLALLCGLGGVLLARYDHVLPAAG